MKAKDQLELFFFDRDFDKVFFMNLGLSFFCLAMAALAAGLTLSLLSLEPFQLRILLTQDERECRNEEEIQNLRRDQYRARRILPIIKNHHYLLVTLLLINSMANESLPLFLDNLVSPYVAAMISVTLVLLVGEIIPSALFTGTNQLKYASNLIPVVYLAEFILYPIVKPISLLLDYMLGHNHDDGAEYSRSQLRSIVTLHKHAGEVGEYEYIQSPGPEFLNDDEVNIVKGALLLHEKKAKDVMVPFDKVFALSIDTVLDEEMLAQILGAGYSRIPIYEDYKHNIKGLLLVKRLIVINPTEKRTIRSLYLRPVLVVHEKSNLFDLLNEFQTGKLNHLAIVCKRPEQTERFFKAGANQPIIKEEAGISGILTLEDILEQLIQENIYDEHDQKTGVRKLLSRRTKLQHRLKMLKKLKDAELKKIAIDQEEFSPLKRSKSSSSSYGT